MRTKRVYVPAVVMSLIVVAMGQGRPGSGIVVSDVAPPVTTATVAPAPDYGGYYYAAGAAINVVLSASDTVRGTWTTIDNVDAGWIYDGWSNAPCGECGFFGGSIHAADRQGASAELTFIGIAVEIYGSKTPAEDLDPGESLGITEVFVDGASRGTFDYYTPPPEVTQTLLFAIDGLAASEHTLRLEKQDVDGSTVHVDFIRVQAADGSDSGVVSTEYRLNGGPWTPYGSALNLVEPVGEYVLEFRSTDGVGNVEDAKSIKFGIAELPLTPLAGVAGTPFSDGGSWIYHYPSRPEPYDYSGQSWAYDPTTLTSIIADLRAGWYTDRGITNLMMYGPYWATGEFRGLPALRDFMDIDPEIGTIKAWRDMVSLANSQGITVTTYLAVPYIHVDSTLFVQAQEDRRDNVMSFERSIFRWDDRIPEGSNPPPAFGGTGTPPSDVSVPRPSQGDWAWSSIADRWYATAWGHPAIDFEGGGMEFMKSVVRFWMDNGVQGIEWDAPQSVWGLSNSDARHREIVTYANTYRPDWENYIHGEGLCTFGNQAICDRAGHTHILLNGDDDFNSLATRVGRIPQTLTPDQLDLHWQSFHDHRQLLGRGTYSWSLYDYDVDPGLRALDAAVQAGSGAQYSIDFPMMVRNSKNDVLPESTLELVWDVHRALRNSPALRPSASRQRVPTNIDPGSGNFRGYSVLRRSADTDDNALNVYNFNNAEKCITLDLTGTGITFPQRTTSIATGAAGPWILSDTPTFRLPAYGWLFLDVSVDPAFPWTIIDDLDQGWTWGSVWAQVPDASAFGGTRHQGNGTTAANAANAWGEITFAGRSVQGYGRMATGSNANTGATTAVEVFIDGVSYGIHSQRRPSDEGTSDGERHGRMLFSISGLTPGEHTLRIQQVSTTTANGGPSGIDYIKVSDEDFVASTPPSGGDRCRSDVTPPVTTLHGQVLSGGPGVSISLEVNDPDPEPSGVARVEYRINGGAWIEYEHVPFELTDRGSYAVDHRSIDVAGNVEQTWRTTVFVGTPGNVTISGASVTT